MNLHSVLRCQLSGLTIGTVQVITTAGALPYVGHWDKLIVRHPVFNLTDHKLFKFAEHEWKRLAGKAADEEITDKESELLRVTWLAILHSLESVKQDRPSLPELHIVQSTMSRLVHLAYWKFNLDSAKFQFPEYHLSKQNNNLDFAGINDYINVCFEYKNTYATRVTEIIEADRIKVTERALEALTSEWINPVSRKVLWAWVKANLPADYDADKQGWMNTLFLGGGNAIVEFQEEDLELLEEIITTECPTHATVMFAVRQRLAKIWEIWRQHHRTFEIDLADYALNQGTLVNGVQVKHPDPGPEPQKSQFVGQSTKYIIAHAKWTIAYKAWEAQNRKSDDPQVNDQLGEI